MKNQNELKAIQQQKLLQITLVSAAVVGIIVFLLFLQLGLFSSHKSQAATATVSSGSIAYASSDPFNSLNNGDTILVLGKFYVDQEYTINLDSITIIVDGSNAELKLFTGYNLWLGAGSTIELRNSAKIKLVGKCDSTTVIYIDSTIAASCDGTGGSSFDDLNNSGGTLPVEWLSVDADLISESEVELLWSTAAEINNDFFMVEYSIDNINWNQGATIPSKSVGGNSQAILEYSSIHRIQEMSPVVYFRIKQVDFDKTGSYSDIIPVQIKPAAQYNIASLGSNQIRINGITDPSGRTALRVHDMTGKLIMENELTEGQIVTLPSSGIYILEIGTGTAIQRIKQFVQ